MCAETGLVAIWKAATSTHTPATCQLRWDTTIPVRMRSRPKT